MAAAVLAVLALAAGTVTAVTLLTGGGGAGTASEAVTLLAADLESSSYLDAASRLHPAEARIAADLSEVVTDELTRLEVFRPGAAPDAALGSLTVAGLRFDEQAAEQVREDVVITKLVGGTITFAQDPAALPFTDSFRALAFPAGSPAASGPATVDIAQVVAEQGEPLRVASVRVDGEWYVSLLYTVADYALREEGIAWPAGSIEARGAASPQDALRETVQAALDGDVRRLVELAPPGELQVIHDLGEVIVDRADAERSGARIVELETAASEVRGSTALALSKLVVVTPDGQRITVTHDGDCLEFQSSDGSRERGCAEDLLSSSDLPLDEPVLRRVLPRLARAAFDVRVVTVEVDGAHYVSPAGTLVGLYADVLGTLEPRDVADLLALAD